MTLKDSFINLNKALGTTLQNVPAVVDTLERGFSEISEGVSTSAEAKKATNSFNTINGGLLSECIVKLVPVQSGSGDPSPDNVRPISGHTQVDVDVSDGQTTQEQITVNFGDTYYSGTLDVVTGVLTVDKARRVFDGTEDWKQSDTGYFLPTTLSDAKASALAISNLYKYSTTTWESGCFGIASGKNLWVGDMNLLSVISVNNLTVVYELESPQSIQLSPTMIKALVGENHLSAPLDGQEITEVEYKEIFTFSDVEKAINNAIASVYPEAPAADGSYVLTLVKDGTTITRSWVSTEP